MARSRATPPKPDLGDDTAAGGGGTEDLIIAADEPNDGGTVVVDANGADVVEESVETLREQLAAANERAERAEAARQNSDRRVENSERTIAESNLQVIANAISTADAEKKLIRDRIKAAKEAGDYDAEIIATDELQTTNVKIARLTEGKTELERRIEEAKEIEEAGGGDPIEQYIAGSKLNGRAASWVRQHPDLIVTNGAFDKTKLEDLETAHFRALGNRIHPGTDAYFEFMEGELLGTGQQEEHVEPTPKPKTNGARPPAAPPSRSNQSSGGVQSRSLPAGITMTADGKYRMSPERREAARIAGISEAEYLKNALAVHNEQTVH